MNTENETSLLRLTHSLLYVQSHPDWQGQEILLFILFLVSERCLKNDAAKYDMI